MNLFKLLYEEPEKLQVLIINFIKLLLTLLITHSLFEFNELNNLGSITKINPVINLNDILYYILVLFLVWFVIWIVLDLLFSACITITKNPSKKTKDLYRSIFKELFNKSFFYTKTKGGYVYPKKHIHIVAELGKIGKTSNIYSLNNTLFVKIIYLSIIILGYLISITPYSNVALIIFIISAILILVSIWIIRFFGKFLDAFKNHSTDINSILQNLLFKYMVINVIQNVFFGKLNDEESSLIVNLKDKKKITILDFGFFNSSIGNISLIQTLTGEQKLDKNTLIISNITPNNEVITLIKEQELVGFITAKNEDELIERIITLVNQLDSNTEIKN